MQALKILRADMSHLKILTQLSSKTFYDTYAHENTKENMEEYLEEHFSEIEIKKELEDSSTFIFIAFSKGNAIGYVKLGTATSPEQLNGKPAIEIERIYVLKNYQSMKTGAALLKHAIDFAKTKKIKIIWLGVWKKNLRAIKFYERAGFQKFGEHIFTLGRDLQEDFVMKLDL